MKSRFCFLLLAALISTSVFGVSVDGGDARYVYPEGAKLTLSLDDYNKGRKYYFCYANNKVGLVDGEKHVIVPIEYDEVKSSRIIGSCYIRQGQNWGLMTLSGWFVIPPVVKNISYPEIDYYVITEWDGTVTKIDDSNSFMDKKIDAFGRKLKAKYNWGKVFNIDFSEAKYIDVDKYWTNGVFSNGLMPIWNVSSKKLGFVNDKGELAVPCSIPMNSPSSYTDKVFFKGKHLVMYNNTGTPTYQVYDKTGKKTYEVPFNKNGIYYAVSHFEEGGFALLRTKDAKGVVRFKYIDENGHPVFTNVYAGKGFHSNVASYDLSEFVRPMSDGMVAYAEFINYGDRIWGFFDKNGVVVVPAKYKAVHDFSEGLAAVQMTDKAENAEKWGFVDHTGKLVIPARYSNEPCDFHNGYALVKKTNGRYVYIDKQGNVVSEEYVRATSFHNGYAFIEIYKDQYAKERYSINTDFKIIECYIPDALFSIGAKKLSENNGGNGFHQNVACYGYEGKRLTTNTGEDIVVYSEKDYTIKNCSENLVHVKYGEHPNSMDIFCDYTGKVKFVLRLNEF